MSMTRLVFWVCLLFLGKPIWVWATNQDNILTVWTSSENVKNAISRGIEKFEKDYQIKIRIDVLNQNLTSQFKTAALSGKGPDFFVWNYDVIGELVESGFIEPIIMRKDLADKFVPVALRAFSYKGKIYGYPYAIESTALIFNKKLLPKMPDTMEELVSSVEKIQNSRPNTYGILYDLKNFYFTFPLMSAGGGYIFKDNNGILDINDIGLSNAGAQAGINFLSNLVQRKLIPSSANYNIADEKFKSGELAVAISGPWAISDIRKSGVDYEVAPFPKLNGNYPAPFLGAHGFIVRRSSKNKELAMEFIENYLVTAEGILNLYKEDPRIPSREDVVNLLSEGKNGNKDLKAFLESAARGTLMPNIPQMGAVWGAMGTALSLVIDGRSSTEDALNSAVTQIKFALETK